MERLDKLLASTGHWSRKEVKDMVRQGRVLADGLPVKKPEEKFDPDRTCIQVDGRVDGDDVAALAEGMVLGDGLHCLPAGLEPLEDGSRCLVTLREGKYHQVKRMLAARGKPVLELRRLSMGPVSLDECLGAGEWRYLTAQEMDSLRGCAK